MDVAKLDTFLLVGAAVLLAAILAVRLSVRAGLPSLLIYLAMGVLLGEAVLGVQFEDAQLTNALGFAALVVIIAEGGLTTRWTDVRGVMPLGVVLATAGVAVSVAVVAVTAHWLLGLDWQLAVLLGAVTSPTDAAAVFSVARRVPLRPRLSASLEAESGLNDAATVLLVTLVSEGTALQEGPLAFAGILVYELVVGAAGGVAIGWLGARLIGRVALPASGLYPLAVLSLCVLAYAGTAAIHASGFAAVYLAALVLGNTELPHRPATRSFSEGLAWLAQIGLFVMLGLLASPARIDLGVLGAALLIGLILTAVARPLSVAVSAAPFRVPWREQAFLSWAGLRGAVPIVLATIPLAEQVQRASTLFDTVFVLVVAFTLLQAPSLPAVARRLSVVSTTETGDVEVEAAPLERIAADLLQIRVPDTSRLHGVEIGELRLPSGVAVSLVVREGSSFVPDPRTVLRHGDEVFVVTPRRLREPTESRFRAVGRRGRLAGWFGEHGAG